MLVKPAVLHYINIVLTEGRMDITLNIINIMKKLAILFAALCVSASAVADTWVRGHFRDNGTYVQPHYRSSPDNSYNNNWSVRPNVNPYTGQRGTRAPRYPNNSPYSTYRDRNSPLYNSPYSPYRGR